MRGVVAVGLVMTLASPVCADSWSGTVKLGGTIFDETGDRSTVQETYNIYDGFSVTQIRLNGSFAGDRFLSMDLRDLNQPSRQGDVRFRVPGVFQVGARFDEHRQVFDPDRVVDARRKDWRIDAGVTPNGWLNVYGSVGRQSRTGDRLPFPTGTTSVLGTSYDNALISGDVTAEAHQGPRGAALTFRMSDYRDDLNSTADRRGEVLSLRLYGPSWFYDRWTHLVRGSYGLRTLSNGDLEHTFGGVQYTGVIQPVDPFEFRYAFSGERVDDEALDNKTDRFQNDVDVFWSHAHGQLRGGYGYELNDDDRSLTSYQTWRVGATLRDRRYVSGSVDYASRVKQDQEDLTLLKDIESSQVRAKLELKPALPLVVGGRFLRRERDLQDLDVHVDGSTVGGYGRYTLPAWGAASADYSYADDDYTDLSGGFHTISHIVTGRVDFERVPGLRLSGGATYVKAAHDLRIEKSMVLAEASYRVLPGYRLEAAYNVYNYDDYILLDRYYTANVVRINLAHDFGAE